MAGTPLAPQRVSETGDQPGNGYKPGVVQHVWWWFFGYRAPRPPHGERREAGTTDAHLSSTTDHGGAESGTAGQSKRDERRDKFRRDLGTVALIIGAAGGLATLL